MKTFAQPRKLQANHVILTNGKDPRAKRLFENERINVQQRLRQGMFRSGST